MAAITHTEDKKNHYFERCPADACPGVSDEHRHTTATWGKQDNDMSVKDMQREFELLSQA